MRAVRYGTALNSFVSSNIFTRFPNIGEFEIVKPTEDRPHGFYEVYALETKRNETAGNSSRGLPSISMVNGCNAKEQQALYWWQYKLMKEMGFAEFHKHMKAILARGSKFHSAVHNLLKALKKDGKIPNFDEAFNKENEDIRGFVESIAKFLPTLNLNPLMCMEQKVVSQRLGYQGRFDAIIELNGELTLVDWKTINTYSAKAQREVPSATLSLAELYSNPVQVAAYVAAVNASCAFADYPTIRQAAVILAYEDGRPAETVLMNEEEIEHHFQTHLCNLNYFWYEIMTRRPDISGQIRMVFNPYEQQQQQGKPDEPTAAKAATSGTSSQ